MKKIITTKEAIRIAKNIHDKDKSIVLTGGFFDILHKGHIQFLENAKKQGDYLFVLLEDDKNAKKTKGPDRPINSQEKRATVLSSLPNIDYIVMLKNMTNNDRYDKIIFQISPNIIATTKNDPNIRHKKRQAKLINAKVMNVIERIEDYSTTKLAKQLKENLASK